MRAEHAPGLVNRRIALDHGKRVHGLVQRSRLGAPGHDAESRAAATDRMSADFAIVAS